MVPPLKSHQEIRAESRKTGFLDVRAIINMKSSNYALLNTIIKWQKGQGRWHFTTGIISSVMEPFSFFCPRLFLGHFGHLCLSQTLGVTFLFMMSQHLLGGTNLRVSLFTTTHDISNPCAQLGSAKEFNALWGSPLTSGRKELVNIFFSVPHFDGLP